MINNGGVLQFTIPTDIAPGNYLLRGEIIALHGAYNVNGAQPYVGMLVSLSLPSPLPTRLIYKSIYYVFTYF
jgi:hypothetical protein